jgi:hypothetical protein
VLALRIEGATDTRLQGTRAMIGDVSGVWGIDEPCTLRCGGIGRADQPVARRARCSNV